MTMELPRYLQLLYPDGQIPIGTVINDSAHSEIRLRQMRLDLIDHLDWKYRLTAPISVKVNLPDIGLRFLAIEDGWMTLKVGYAYDGASGPAVDTPTNLNPAAIHDGWYQLIRIGHIDKSYRKTADKMFYKHLLEAGTTPARARYFYWAVHSFGWWNARRAK